MKIRFFFFFFFFFIGGGGGGGQVGGGGVGVRVDMNEELNFFLENSQKKFGRGSGGSVRVGVVRVDVNEELKFL